MSSGEILYSIILRGYPDGTQETRNMFLRVVLILGFEMKYYTIVDDSGVDYDFIREEPGSWLGKVVVGADEPCDGCLTVQQPSGKGTWTADVSRFELFIPSVDVDDVVLTRVQWLILRELELEIFRRGVDGGEATSEAIDALHVREREFGVFVDSVRAVRSPPSYPRWQEVPARFAPVRVPYIELNLLNFLDVDVAQLNAWGIQAVGSLGASVDLVKDVITELSAVAFYTADPRDKKVVNDQISLLKILLGLFDELLS